MTPLMPRTQAPTRDAWVLLSLATTLYIGASIFLQSFSIIGGVLAAQVLGLFLPSLVYAKWKTGGIKEALRLRPVSAGVLWRVVLLAVTGMGLATLVDQATRPLALHFFPDWIPILEALMQIVTPKTPQDLLQNLCVIGIAAPICEEVLFRGAFQGTLEKRGPVRAVAFSALMFGLIHLNPFNFVGPILFGVGIGFIAWRTGSIYPAILWHALNNSLAVLLLYFGGTAFSTPLWVDVGLAVLFVVLLWDFICHTRGATSQPSPLAAAPDLMRGGALRFASVSGAVCVLLLLGGTTCFGYAKLGSDFLAPEYRTGDFVIYKRGLAFQLEEVRPTDVVIYRDSKGGLRFSRVLKTKGEHLTMLGSVATHPEVVIQRKDVLGKAVWKFDPGEEVKQMMSQDETGSSPSQKGHDQ